MMRTNQLRRITFARDDRPALIASLWRRIDADVVTAACSTDPSRVFALRGSISQNRALLAATSTDVERFNKRARENTRATGERKTGKRKFTEELHKRDKGGKFSKSEEREGGGRYGGPEKGVSYKKDKKKGGSGSGKGKGKGSGGKGAADTDTGPTETQKRSEQRAAEAEARRVVAEEERQAREATRQKEYEEAEAERAEELERDSARVGRYEALRAQNQAASDQLNAHLEQVALGYESYEAERLAASDAARAAVGAMSELKLQLREAEALNDQDSINSLTGRVTEAEEVAKEALRAAVHLDLQRGIKQQEVKIEKAQASRERARLDEVLAAQRRTDSGERSQEAAAKRAKAEVARRNSEIARREATAKAAAERAARAVERAEDKALADAERAARAARAAAKKK